MKNYLVFADNGEKYNFADELTAYKFAKSLMNHQVREEDFFKYGYQETVKGVYPVYVNYRDEKTSKNIFSFTPDNPEIWLTHDHYISYYEEKKLDEYDEGRQAFAERWLKEKGHWNDSKYTSGKISGSDINNAEVGGLKAFVNWMQKLNEEMVSAQKVEFGTSYSELTKDQVLGVLLSNWEELAWEWDNPDEYEFWNYMRYLEEEALNDPDEKGYWSEDGYPSISGIYYAGERVATDYSGVAGRYWQTKYDQTWMLY